jgi:hypothetical protein
MKTKTKALAMAMCAVLLVVASVFTTLAYLTATTETVKNTFTVGANVAITLDETEVDALGKEVENAGKVKSNKYTLVPGHTYKKDPTVHVTAGGAECWVFIKVENGLSGIISGTSIEKQITDNNWVKVEGTTNVYAYKETVTPASDKNTDLPVFASFTVSSDAFVSTADADKDNTLNLNKYASATIEITAYAVQADGFKDASKTAIQNATQAWNSTFGKTETAPESSSNTEVTTNS